MWSPSKLGEDRGDFRDQIVPLELYPGLHAQGLSMTSIQTIGVYQHNNQNKSQLGQMCMPKMTFQVDSTHRTPVLT